jgi:cyclase
MFTEEASGVFSVASRFVDGMNGIVVGERAALAIDCSNYEDEGQAMADFIRDKGFEPNRLVLTHGHGDHIWGGKPLKSGEVFAHHLTPGVMERQVPQAVGRRDVSEETIRSEMPWPTVTYREELWIDLGGKTVWMFPSPGHSVDGVSVYVVEDKLLFSGDSVVNGIVAAIGDGDSRILEQSLYKLMDVDIETLVPGHGKVLHGKDRVLDWLQWQVGYLGAVRDRVQKELASGKDAEAAAEAVDYASFIGDRLPIDRNGMPKRHRNTVDKIIEEEQVG